MKLALISVITASACLASFASPTFAQSTPAEIADFEAAKAAAHDKAVTQSTRATIVVPEKTAPLVVPAPAIIAAPAHAGGRPFDSMISSHASSNGIPAELVHRVIVRESRYRASAMGRGGASGLMQIKLATARSMGYSGSAAGLLDPDTNLTYGVRYLAGAYRAAGGNHGRAVGYYASGYHGAARPARAYARMRSEPALFTTTASAEPVVEVQERAVRRKRR
jgi:soluble lytic murein transglycosylase-like protein